MVVCKFFQEGRCRYGDGCRNEHPVRNSFQQPQTNRFAPLSNQGGSGAFGTRGRSGNVDDNPYHLITEDIRNDLTHLRDRKEGERPAYPFGAYGPGRGAPKQLIEGTLEVSPEELRVQAYLARASGTLPQFEAQYAQLEHLMNSKVQNILSNTEDAKRYASDESHPNRNDAIIKPAPETWPWRVGQGSRTSSGGFGSSSGVPPAGFGAAAQPSSGFGAPSRPGFGGASQPAFGAPSMHGGSGAFGAPSALGVKPSPFGASGGAAPSAGFGAPSALGAKSSPFGAPQSAGGFGAPSVLGAKPNPFGGAQQTAAAGFGAPSALGHKPSSFGGAQQTASGAFGAPSQPAFGSSGFGAGAAKAASSPFAAAAISTGNANPFGAASTQPSNSGPFGAAAQASGGSGSQQSTAQANSSPFGSTQQPVVQARHSPFGANSGGQPGTSTFGAPSAFGANRPSPFAASTQQPQNLNRPNPFAAAQQTGTSQPATLGSNTTGQRVPTAWKGKSIVTDPRLNTPGYEVRDLSKPNERGIERIWFPTGPPEVSEKLNAMTEAPAAIYEDPEIGPKLQQVYEWAAQSGTFASDGVIVMPEIPPKREWCTFDF